MVHVHISKMQLAIYTYSEKVLNIEYKSKIQRCRFETQFHSFQIY